MTFNSSPSLWMRCALSVDASHSVSQNEAPNFFVQMSSLVLLRGLCRFSIALVQNPWSKLPHPRISPSFRTALLPEHPEAHSWISRLISLNLRPPLLLSPHPPPHFQSVNRLERFWKKTLRFALTLFYALLQTGRLVWTSLNQSSGVQEQDASSKWSNPMDFETLIRIRWDFKSTGPRDARSTAFGQTRLPHEFKQSMSAMTLSAQSFDFSHHCKIFKMSLCLLCAVESIFTSFCLLELSCFFVNDEMVDFWTIIRGCEK